MLPKPPVCPQREHTLTLHGHTRYDPFFWLNERNNPEVMAYIQAENEYCEAMLAHTKPLQERLFAEMKGRIKEQDETLPYKRDDYYYYLRYDTGNEYPIHCRKKGSLEAPEEVLLDFNELGKGHAYFDPGGIAVSADHNQLAFCYDTVGRRFYDIGLKDLTTGEIKLNVLRNTTGDMTWLEDGSRLLYVVQDPETLRACRVFAHRPGSLQTEDEILYFEEDETFSIGLNKTKSRQYIFIVCHSTLTSEVLVADSCLKVPFEPFCRRETGIEYSLEHRGENFYILTNWQAQNFRLMKAPTSSRSRQDWQEVIAHRENVLLEGLELFDRYMVLEEREEGLTRLRVLAEDGSEHTLQMHDPAYSLYIGYNPEFATDTLRYHYQSLTVPSSVYDYRMDTREQTLVKQHEVVGGHNPEDYISERLLVPAQDGEMIPLSVVYHKSVRITAQNPLYLVGYGAYGISYDPYFSSSRLSLLDRGVVYAIAHVRGGEEKGRRWYEQGRQLCKKNTFSDFIACARYLIEHGYTRADKLAAVGGSAGGLLVGAVINQAPELFGAAVAHVPFVDVVTTMMDSSVPLTTSEYDEWGNPEDEEFYYYMLSYSPYDNIRPMAYPAMLVTAGLHDSQVQYWEPLKWVAKLRAFHTGSQPILLKTNTEAGHSGSQGRFKHLEELAMEYAFLLDFWGLSSVGS